MFTALFNNYLLALFTHTAARGGAWRSVVVFIAACAMVVASRLKCTVSSFSTVYMLVLAAVQYCTHDGDLQQLHNMQP
jgi:hypothetical protein